MLYGCLNCHLRNGRLLEEFIAFSSLKLIFEFSHMLVVANSMIMINFNDNFVTDYFAFIITGVLTSP